jgi:hypothetical protein
MENKPKTIIRLAKNKHFVSIDNRTVRDYRLSWKARGILTYFLTHTDDWEINKQEIRNAGHEGRDSVDGAFKELQKFGYMTHKIEKDDSNRITAHVYQIYEEPLTGFPDMGKHPRKLQKTSKMIKKEPHTDFPEHGIPESGLPEHGKQQQRIPPVRIPSERKPCENEPEYFIVSLYEYYERITTQPPNTYAYKAGDALKNSVHYEKSKTINLDKAWSKAMESKNDKYPFPLFSGFTAAIVALCSDSSKPSDWTKPTPTTAQPKFVGDEREQLAMLEKDGSL